MQFFKNKGNNGEKNGKLENILGNCC